MDKIAGIGTDIVEVERIRAAVERFGEVFLRRVFTLGEQNFCNARRDRYACYAARFAAKEAVLKALAGGLAGCKWTDVEVIRLEGESPQVLLRGGAAELAGAKKVNKVMLSLSHDRCHATAFAVALEGGS